MMARMRSYWREPSVLFWTFGFPIVLAVALGIAFRNRPPEPIEVAIEPTCAANLRDENRIRVVEMSAEESQKALRTGRVALAVTCDGPTFHFDPTRPDARVARLVVFDTLERAAGRVDRTAPRDAQVTEPGARYIDFLVPGLIGSNIMSAGLWGLGFSLVEMRVRNLLKRLAATPMRRMDFLSSFIVVRALLLFVELPVLLIFSRFAFGVHVFGSIPLLFAVAVIGSLLFAGFGVLVASRAKNTQTVSGLINLVSMPMYLCSGVFFSAEKFPESIKPIVRVLPLTALIDAMRKIMTEGQTLSDIAPEIGIMAIWSAVVFAVSLRLFRWR